MSSSRPDPEAARWALPGLPHFHGVVACGDPWGAPICPGRFV